MLLSRRHIPLNAMRTFEAAAVHCNLRQAAEELGVTHGAVSRQVKQLEGILGVELFDRSHNRMSLTSAGQRLLQGVQEGLDRIAESALYLDPDSMNGDLVIASTPSISAGWLVNAIGQFNQKYPEIQLHLVNITPRQREIPAEVDVAICYGAPELTKRDCEELFRERYFPVCHPSLLKAEQPIVKPDDLMDYPLLHDRHGYWGAWFKGVDTENNATKHIYFQDSFQVLTAVREGYGIALLDRVDIQRELRNGTLVALFDETIEADESHFLVRDKKERSTVRATLFAEYIRSYLEL